MKTDTIKGRIIECGDLPTSDGAVPSLLIEVDREALKQLKVNPYQAECVVTVGVKEEA